MPGLLEGVLAAAKARTAAALVKPVVKPNVSKTEVKPKAVVTPKTPSKAGTPKPIAGTLNAVSMTIEQLKSKVWEMLGRVEFCSKHTGQRKR